MHPSGLSYWMEFNGAMLGLSMSWLAICVRWRSNKRACSVPPEKNESMTSLHRSFFERSAIEVAKDLIGATLVFNGVGGVIVETEAYLLEDPASHSFKGVTRRNGSMFGPPGRAYIYRSYGLHWCLNAVCSRGSAVLIRALEPTIGVSTMGVRRSCQDIRLLCSAPGRLCQALGINGSHDGLALNQEPFEMLKAAGSALVCVGKRIGISKTLDEPWRFGLTGSNFLSRKF